MVQLTMKEAKKLEVVQMVMDGKIDVLEGAKVLSRSERQVYRMLRSVREEGVKGIIHGNRGNGFARKLMEGKKEQIVSLAKGRYHDINDTHLRELLEKREGIVLSRESLRLLLRSTKIAPKRKRRARKYRSRRERKEAMGMMLQIDASHHDWLEGRGPRLVLVGAIDDATGYVWAHFEEAETTWAYLRLMHQILLSHGVPLSLYSDRHMIFHSPKEPTIVEQLKNVRPLTQFGRAMSELNIELIKAWSAPAKGRIERLWGTSQDRLIVEMRLANISTREEANAFLAPYLMERNQQSTVVPRQRTRVFRKRPAMKKLKRILCLKETRDVAKDHTVRFEGLVLQIPPSSKWASIAKQPVEVLQLEGGQVEIVYKQQVVARFSHEAVERLVASDQLPPSDLKRVT